MESERVLTKIQVEDIRFTNGDISDIIEVGSMFRYSSNPLFTDLLSIPNIAHVSTMIGDSVIPIDDNYQF